MPARTFVDTNVLVYTHDVYERAKQTLARSRLAADPTEVLVVSTQVLQELYVTLQRGPTPLTSAEGAEIAVREALRLVVVAVDVSTILSAISLSRDHVVSLWDALLVAAAQTARCTTLLTEDLNDGQLFGELRVENPFRSLAAKPARRR